MHTPLVDHRCRRADRCAEWQWLEPDPRGTVDGAPVRAGAPINQAIGLCPACERYLSRCLAELPVDYVELSMLIGATAAPVIGEPVTGSRELPTPLRLPVDAVRRAMVYEATTWAEAVAERLRIEWNSQLIDRYVRDGVALQTACQLLRDSLSVLLAVRDWTAMVWTDDGWTAEPVVRDGVDGALSLIALHRRARAFAGATRLVHRLPAGCPHCRRRSLCRDDGDDRIYCAGCHHTYTDDDYRQLVHVLAGAFADTAFADTAFDHVGSGGAT